MKQEHVILRALAPDGSDVRARGPLEGSIRIKGLTSETDNLEPAQAKELERSGAVVAVAPVVPMRLIEPRIEATAALATGIEWGLGAVGAVDAPVTGKDVVVAVLDTGIDPNHPAFAGVELVRKNFTGEANADDGHGHGTHCAGTIFGRDVGGRRIGVALGVKKAIIGKVLGRGGGGSGQVVSAINWAIDSGANVISMSLGIDFPGAQRFYVEQRGFPPELATSLALEGYRANVTLFERLSAFVRALDGFDRTAILVAAAGNESRTDKDPAFKIAVSPPAVADGIVSVAAVGQGPGGKLVVAPFSNTGALVAGPGVAITSAAPGGGLATMSGTSMATPHVAGVAALWAERLRQDQSLNSRNLFTRVVASATRTGLAPGVDPHDVGGGVVQAPR